MLIYTPKITSRIQYSFELIFNSILNIDFDLSEDIVLFQNFSGPKLNY